MHFLREAFDTVLGSVVQKLNPYALANRIIPGLPSPQANVLFQALRANLNHAPRGVVL